MLIDQGQTDDTVIAAMKVTRILEDVRAIANEEEYLKGCG